MSVSSFSDDFEDSGSTNGSEPSDRPAKRSVQGSFSSTGQSAPSKHSSSKRSVSTSTPRDNDKSDEAAGALYDVLPADTDTAGHTRSPPVSDEQDEGDSVGGVSTPRSAVPDDMDAEPMRLSHLEGKQSKKGRKKKSTPRKFGFVPPVHKKAKAESQSYQRMLAEERSKNKASRRGVVVPVAGSKSAKTRSPTKPSARKSKKRPSARRTRTAGSQRPQNAWGSTNAGPPASKRRTKTSPRTKKLKLGSKRKSGKNVASALPPRFCVACGAGRDAADRFCRQCGEFVSQRPVSTSPLPEDLVSQTSVRSRASSRRYEPELVPRHGGVPVEEEVADVDMEPINSKMARAQARAEHLEAQACFHEAASARAEVIALANMAHEPYSLEVARAHYALAACYVAGQSSWSSALAHAATARDICDGLRGHDGGEGVGPGEDSVEAAAIYDFHPAVLHTLGTAQLQMGDGKGAIRSLQRAIALSEEAFGKGDPSTYPVYVDLACAYDSFDDVENYAKYLDEGCKVLEAACGVRKGKDAWHVDHTRAMELVALQIKVAEAYSEQDRDADALEAFLRAKFTINDLLPPLQALVSSGAPAYSAEGTRLDPTAMMVQAERALARVSFDIGNVYADMEQPGEAEACFKEAAEISRRHPGQEGMKRTVRATKERALMLIRMRMFADALSLLLKVLIKQKKSHGPDAPALADTHKIVATLYLRESDSSLALEHYEKAFQILKHRFGLNHPRTQALIETVSTVKEHLR